MQIEVFAKGVELTQALRDRIKQRIGFALLRFAGLVERVHVHLVDENGPKGAVDKACRIQVRLIGLEPVVAEQRFTDIRTSIDLAAQRTVRALTEKVDRTVSAMFVPAVSKPTWDER